MNSYLFNQERVDKNSLAFHKMVDHMTEYVDFGKVDLKSYVIDTVIKPELRTWTDDEIVAIYSPYLIDIEHVPGVEELTEESINLFFKTPWDFVKYAKMGNVNFNHSWFMKRITGVETFNSAQVKRFALTDTLFLEYLYKTHIDESIYQEAAQTAIELVND